jgi:DNA-binding MarR family transcriptional regulator
VSRPNPLRFDPIEEAARNWRGAGWDEAAPGMALVTSIMRAHQILLARVDATLRPLGLTFARFEVLMLLDFSRTGRLPLSKIGQRLQVHPASVTNAIDRLEGDGLVERRPHPTDGRTTLAAITPSGRRLVRRAAGALNTDVFGDVGLDTADIEAVVTALTVLRRNAVDFVEPAGPVGSSHPDTSDDGEG